MGQHLEEWKELCQQVAVEQNPERLVDLIHRINDLLEAKRRRLESDELIPKRPKAKRKARAREEQIK